MSKTNRSQSQSQASRTNGAKSNGPITPEGKEKSSQNATRHGLHARRDVLVNESQAEYDHLKANYFAEWTPIGQTEHDLLDRLISATWRHRRIRRIADALLDSEIFILKDDSEAAYHPLTPVMRQADAISCLSVENPNALEHLRRSELVLDRSISRAKKELIEMQTMRLGHEPKLNPQQPDQAVSAPPLETKSPSQNEPGENPRNPHDDGEFEWNSLFTPSYLRPHLDRRTWRNPAFTKPEDQAA